MNTGTQTQYALHLAHQQGLLRARDLVDLGIPRAVLTRMVQSGELERVARGLYCAAGNAHQHGDTLSAVSSRVPTAVYCLLTALQFHGLTTQLPRQVWIALPRGSHTPKIEYPPLRMVQFSAESFKAGIEVHQRGDAEIRVYSAAKTVADCFKYRNRIGQDVALEALRDAWAQRKANADDLWRFAKINRVANVMRPYMEATL